MDLFDLVASNWTIQIRDTIDWVQLGLLLDAKSLERLRSCYIGTVAKMYLKIEHDFRPEKLARIILQFAHFIIVSKFPVPTHRDRSKSKR